MLAPIRLLRTTVSSTRTIATLAAATAVLTAVAVGVGRSRSDLGELFPDGAVPLGRWAGSLERVLDRPEPRHPWRLVRDLHWQIISREAEEPAVTDAREGTRGVCPAGMVEVRGDMLAEPSPNPYSDERIGSLQLRTCTRWLQKHYPERCAEFDRDRWLAIQQSLPRQPMHYCIDRFEYPNLAGQFPLIHVSWLEARDVCVDQGKRLCSEDEWTFACEGQEGKPYPYGYSRDPSRCVVDQEWRPYDGHAMIRRDDEDTMLELDRLWQGVASGARAGCRSDFGVYDMTGNVDEWTRSVRPLERPSILKGGYWGPVRGRCRPSTRSHTPDYVFYQQGFRCCQAAPGEASPRPATAQPRHREAIR